MSLSAGTKIGSYEVLHLIGAGGMGEVYRAHDTRLGRDAALKVLPENLIRNEEHLARFQREAMALASLSHPNVAQIYGMEEFQQNRCIVMELVEGVTLAERIRQGPVPLDDALEISLQIAQGMQAAHDRGIIHRDLKPSNVKVTAEGKTKILDFGLAKALDQTPASSLSNAPTANLTGTQAGVILGTVAYMSPEQAKGKAADVRSDIWAFGVILYEMLTGHTPFEGETAIEILGGVTRAEPDWSALPVNTPQSIRSLLRRCLQKDPNRRIHHIADARIEIEEAIREPQSELSPQAPSRTRERILWIAALLIAIVGTAGIWMLSRPGNSVSEDVVRLSLVLDGQSVAGDVSPLALSPDGSMLAYVSGLQLYLRPMNSLEAKSVAGARPASAPFFSTDGKWIGFFGGGKLHKVSASGGSPEVIADAPAVRGASWGFDDYIYFSFSSSRGLRRVSAKGGPTEDITSPEQSTGEISHRFPQALPGGKALLFTVWTGPGSNERQVELLILETKERRIVAKNGHTGRYIPSGHVVYTRDGNFMAVPFDLDRLEVTGPPFALGELIREGNEGALFAVSERGDLAYVPGSQKQFERQIGWIDRNGKVETLPAPLRNYADLALSPDGRVAAVDVGGGTRGIWIYDFARNTLSPLPAKGSSQFPKWTSDGKSIVYRGTRSGRRNLYLKAADGSGEEVQLTDMANNPTPGSLSKDGKWILFDDGDPVIGTSTDIFFLNLEEKQSPQLFLRSSHTENQARISPDGQWVAYTSNESSRNEIYVRPFQGSGQKIPISTNGGTDAQWSSDGRELFYMAGRKMMAVPISTKPLFQPGSSRVLFESRFGEPSVAPNGQRFLVILPTEEEDQPLSQVNVVTNWADELKRRESGKK